MKGKYVDYGNNTQGEVTILYLTPQLVIYETEEGCKEEAHFWHKSATTSTYRNKSLSITLENVDK